MALLEMGGKQFTIGVGDTVLGRDAGNTIPVQGDGVLPRHAIFQALRDGQVVIRKAVPQAEVTINGVRLGGEPTPLLHGDKVEVGGHELTFVDERRSGSTQYLQAMKPGDAAAALGAGAAGGGHATAATGGRVVCLTDGREYVIAGSSLVFGRDATCDVVIPGRDASRRHAEIVPTPRGYLLVDSSTNGTFVNEERLEGQRLLVRADIVRIGDEQFRFYADSAPARGAATPPPPGASERLKDTAHGAPGSSAGPAPARAPLATFLVRVGELKGQRIFLRTPIVNVGRADYNDIVLPDPSVSTAHAKLQYREGVWVLVDLDSTNGSFVDGEPVTGEAAVPPGASVRFGDVALDFEPADDSAAVTKGGGTALIQGFDFAAQKPAAPSAAKPARVPFPPAPAPQPTPPLPSRSPSPPLEPKAVPAAPSRRKRPAQARPPEAKKGKGCGSSAAAVLVGAVALVYWVLV